MGKGLPFGTPCAKALLGHGIPREGVVCGRGRHPERVGDGMAVWFADGFDLSPQRAVRRLVGVRVILAGVDVSTFEADLGRPVRGLDDHQASENPDLPVAAARDR